ncbi:UNKNOWN [Stylonychia lemnae]|uniref:Uncharacterized protein n=1 Tax=Stylonychia lemnae TaxID=5949 RepID=A0A078AS94_STYLE|nr:UNKNOWN [Stylonychia lemnae]|eukprot:CDW85335.1 UNKNOWN [Stylonychia lemnae]
MSIDDQTQQIVIAGINYDCGVAKCNSQTGYPFVAFIEEGNVYRWAYVFPYDSVKFDKVIFSKDKANVIAISGQKPHTIITLNVADGSVQSIIQSSLDDSIVNFIRDIYYGRFKNEIDYFGIAIQTFDELFMLTILKQNTWSQINVMSLQRGQARLLAQSSNAKSFYVVGQQYDDASQQTQSSFSIISPEGVLEGNYIIFASGSAQKLVLITHIYVTQKKQLAIDSIYGIICYDCLEKHPTGKGTQMSFQISQQSKSFITSAGISSKYGVIIAGYTSSSDQGQDLNFQKNRKYRDQYLKIVVLSCDF